MESTKPESRVEAAAQTGEREAFATLSTAVNELIIGQERLMERLIMALLCHGHLLVEGAPGLAKTTAIKVLADRIEGDFHRIQFTPDLLPADLTGTEIYRPQDGSFEFQRGPIFHNLILADEVNRAPAKVQSALLEAMGEHQVTVGRVTYALPQLFLVMATQNPIEQEGTYPLPEAQLDRFLMHVSIGYPDAAAEQEILGLARQQARDELSEAPQAPVLVTQQQVFAAQSQVLELHLAPALQEYIVQLVLATRDPGRWDETLGHLVSYGASPRATIGLDRCSRARAWLDGRDYVSPDDVHATIHDVLRHRVLLSYEAEADGVIVDELVDRLLERVPVP
ncbi:MAG: AAA domain-containing protein [Xanthomonadales bacterium]|nr:AAA domain-containing protein [Xanthomonadales bacterium]NIN60302.1 AAA domain-containing protein [Xanthomonadales bacterium]NIN75654.1 AAA domain-containing protein [Xanthomonadales bacterium]NIO14727.1 AAA domain-containing protein [Xanthomonadales bacterium]NIP12695.1 AAA domain-containing protein [Xanthomonadales bacterium]